MYKVLKIGGKEYKLEYTIEASLYDECTESLFGFMEKTAGSAMDPADLPEDMPVDARLELQRKSMMRALAGISNLPGTALTLFYAGLMEHHGAEGDRTVMSKGAAKGIVREYFEDHADDGTDNFYDLLLICMDQMGEDGFFKRIGLEKIMAAGEEPEEEESKEPKKPQDHKKKAGAN